MYDKLVDATKFNNFVSDTKLLPNWKKHLVKAVMTDTKKMKSF